MCDSIATSWFDLSPPSTSAQRFACEPLATTETGALDPHALFERHGPLVYRRALCILGDAADAEEATQEVFIRALGAVESFDPRSRVSTWLYRITTNYCLNFIRNRARRRELWADHLEASDTPTSTAAHVEKMVVMRRLLAAADERGARAALHVLVDGMSHSEAAVHLGVSKRTVGNLLDRFTRWARDYLTDTVDSSL